MTNTLRVAQWNARSLKSKILEIIYRSNNFDAFFISETWLTPLDEIRVRGFDVVRSDRLCRSGGGVLILIRSEIKYQILDVAYNCGGKVEVCALKVFSTLGELTLVSIYRPPSGPAANSRKWLNFMDQFRGLLLLGGDFNLKDDVKESLLDTQH